MTTILEIVCFVRIFSKAIELEFYWAGRCDVRRPVENRFSWGVPTLVNLTQTCVFDETDDNTLSFEESSRFMLYIVVGSWIQHAPVES